MLIARIGANVELSRRRGERARAILARSARRSETSGPAAPGGRPISNRPPGARGSESKTCRSVLVLAHDPVMRAFIADAIDGHHDVAEASDVPSALKIVAGGARVDAVVAGCFMVGEPGAVPICAGLARELYDHCPWLPVVMVADIPPATLKADLLLTGVRTFLPKDFTPDALAATVARVGRPPDAVVPRGDQVAAVKRIFGVLERAITSVPALAALAAMANMSRAHFSRTFHAVAGISLRDYVRDLRLKRAQELMRASPLSLTAISTASGFYDLPHFNKAFRHRFGVSPTQFRRASVSSPSSPAR